MSNPTLIEAAVDRAFARIGIMRTEEMEETIRRIIELEELNDEELADLEYIDDRADVWAEVI